MPSAGRERCLGGGIPPGRRSHGHPIPRGTYIGRAGPFGPSHRKERGPTAWEEEVILECLQDGPSYHFVPPAYTPHIPAPPGSPLHGYYLSGYHSHYHLLLHTRFYWVPAATPSLPPCLPAPGCHLPGLLTCTGSHSRLWRHRSTPPSGGMPAGITWVTTATAHHCTCRVLPPAVAGGMPPGRYTRHRHWTCTTLLGPTSMRLPGFWVWVLLYTYAPATCHLPGFTFWFISAPGLPPCPQPASLAFFSHMGGSSWVLPTYLGLPATFPALPLHTA